jgi:hypothetical protein
MNIDYAIISSDDSHYLDFYKPVSIAWNHFGIKTMMFHITDTETEFEKNKFGLYKRIKADPRYPTSWQAQLIRLYAYKYFDDLSLLTSDIDMMPLNGDYFKNNAQDLLEDEVLNYSNQPYGNVPYFPICYILGSCKTIQTVLGLESSLSEFYETVQSSYTTKWNTDEHCLYDRLHSYPKLKQLPLRNYSQDRIDRGNWKYESSLIKKGKYIDSHLLRPYVENKKAIDDLVMFLIK